MIPMDRGARGLGARQSVEHDHIGGSIEMKGKGRAVVAERYRRAIRHGGAPQYRLIPPGAGKHHLSKRHQQQHRRSHLLTTPSSVPRSRPGTFSRS
jgi:hypothetical protein